MADYDFDRMTVLVVEDNSFLRSLFNMALKALGVGMVRTVNHGGDAIDLLNLAAENPMKAGMGNVDAILSNWEMSPVDGMMLLRWVRRHKESPSRFVPFIMVTAYSEGRRVAQARDLGVSEFLTKPFSVDTIAEKMVSVVERPRQFVHTAGYFGPDRRRQKLGPRPGAEERRLRTDKSEDVEIVYDSMKIKGGDVTARFYRFRNALKEKVRGLGGGGGDGDGAAALAESRLLEAQGVFDKMAEDYPDWVQGHIDELREQHRRCVDTPEHRDSSFSVIHGIAHEMKGQGGTFGYPLITTFADSLYEFTSRSVDRTDNHVELIKAHVDALSVVIRERVHGDGGDVGQSLHQSLRQAIEKHAH